MHTCVYIHDCVYMNAHNICVCVCCEQVFIKVFLCVCLQIEPHAYNLVTIKHVIVVVFSCFHEVFWLALVINFDIPS